MAYNPAETSARDRVRGRIGDTLDPPLLEGGEPRYDTIVGRRTPATPPVLVAVDGVDVERGEAYATAEAARALAAQIRLEPKSLSQGNEALSYFDPSKLDELADRYAAAADAAIPVDGTGGGPKIGLITAGKAAGAGLR